MKPLLYVGGEFYEVVAVRAPAINERYLSAHGPHIFAATAPAKEETNNGPRLVVNPIPTPKQFLPVGELVAAVGELLPKIEWNNWAHAYQAPLAEVDRVERALKPFTEKEERFWIDERGDLRDREDVDDSAITLKGAANLLNELANSTKEGS